MSDEQDGEAAVAAEEGSCVLVGRDSTQAGDATLYFAVVQHRGGLNTHKNAPRVSIDMVLQRCCFGCRRAVD